MRKNVSPIIQAGYTLLLQDEFGSCASLHESFMGFSPSNSHVDHVEKGLWKYFNFLLLCARLDKRLQRRMLNHGVKHSTI